MRGRASEEGEEEQKQTEQVFFSHFSLSSHLSVFLKERESEKKKTVATMVKIGEKIQAAIDKGETFYSFEYFPPRTEEVRQGK